MTEISQPGTRYTGWHPAGPDTKFAPGAFDGSIGKVIPVKDDDRVIGHERVIAAEVAEDGSGVTLTLEVVDRTPPG